VITARGVFNELRRMLAAVTQAPTRGREMLRQIHMLKEAPSHVLQLMGVGEGEGRGEGQPSVFQVSPGPTPAVVVPSSTQTSQVSANELSVHSKRVA